MQYINNLTTSAAASVKISSTNSFGMPTTSNVATTFKTRAIERTSSDYTPFDNTTDLPITTSTTSDGYLILTCHHFDRTFFSHSGLVGHLRIHRTQTDETVPGHQKHSRDRCIHGLHYACAISHHTGLFSQRRIYDSEIHHNVDNSDTPCTPSAPTILTALPPPLNRTITLQPSEFCPPCASTSNHTAAWSVICESIVQRLAN
ncbi:unnamed protein product [Schistocephalus solidus]|uniref:C2H2-type domain-containing protein n=1 Tax=Schistocephalus solidus TaxID=70667 RepID=A0A183TAC9_SCHSO|nr:unnamed protein product [Schistocephalus solidus]